MRGRGSKVMVVMAESRTQSCGPFFVLACQPGGYLKHRMLNNILSYSIRHCIMRGKILPADSQLLSLKFLQDILRLKSHFQKTYG